MTIKTTIIFFLAICFNMYSAITLCFKDSNGNQCEFFDANKRLINCNALKRQDTHISWDMEKVGGAMRVDAPIPLVFKYSDLLVRSGQYYDRLSLSRNNFFYVVGVDFTDLVASEMYYDDDDEQKYITNTQRIVFDFSSNEIKEISWSDLYRMYAYFVGLANNYSSFFMVTREGFLFNDNPLSIKTRIKLRLLQIVLRLRFLFHDFNASYRYVTW